MIDYPVRILHVFSVMDRGGAESMIMNYYRHVNRELIQFDFLVHETRRGVFEGEIESLGGKIFRIPRVNPIFPYPYFRKMESFLKEHNYSIIHSHVNASSYFPLKVAAKVNIPIRVAHSHTAVQQFRLTTLIKSPAESFKILYKNYLKKKVSKFSTLNIACSEYAGIWLFGIARQFVILHNSIESRKFIYQQEVSKRMRNVFGLKDSFIIGHIGNFSYPKNYPIILNVFNEIKRKNKNCCLVLVGDGKLKPEIELLAKKLDIYDNVKFLGIREDISDLMQMFNVLLFPSHYEGLPVSLIEAQASGLKIFASNNITREVAITNDINFLSLDSSPRYWADQILNTINYERGNNFEIIRTKGYDIEISVKKLEEIYLDQISKITE